MSGFVWQLVAALIAAAVVGLGFQSIFLAVVALIGVALVGEVFKRLVMQRSGPGLLVAARLVTTELESILDRLRRLETDPTLTDDYLLPNTEWARRRADLAATNSYAEAYREIERVNDQWRWRKERRRVESRPTCRATAWTNCGPGQLRRSSRLKLSRASLMSPPRSVRPATLGPTAFG